MATFIMRLQKFSLTSVDTQADYQPDNDAYFVGLNLGGSETPFLDGTVTYIAFGECMSLDGDPEIALAALPAGFRLRGSPLTVRSYDGGIFGTIIGRLEQRTGVAPGTDFSRCISQWGSFGPTTQTKFGSGSAGSNSISGVFADPTEIIDLGRFLSYNIIVTDATKFTTWIFDHLEVTGPYDILNFSWGIANGIDLPNDVKGFAPEEEIIIESSDIFNAATNPDGTGPCLLVVDSIVFMWMDDVLGVQSVTVLPADFNGDWTCLNLTFVLPPTLPEDTEISVIVVSDEFPPILPPEGTGVQFDGSVVLGTLKILVAAVSGLYEIVADKTSDTVYVDSPDSNTTEELAIPDPFGKTGFIGG